MTFSNIHNYYEPQVYNEIVALMREQKRQEDESYLEDVACVALNQLPPRYIRSDVDMAFFLNAEERAEMAALITKVVTGAMEFVDQHHRP